MDRSVPAATAPLDCPATSTERSMLASSSIVVSKNQKVAILRKQEACAVLKQVAVPGRAAARCYGIKAVPATGALQHGVRLHCPRLADVGRAQLSIEPEQEALVERASGKPIQGKQGKEVAVVVEGG